MAVKLVAKQKVGVSLRALIQRINRKLSADDEVLKVARGAIGELGEFYVINYNRNFVVAKNVDPEAWARELGVLKAWEELRND